MRRITIGILGGDSAHQARLSESITRPIRFPDGITRLITARAVLWEALEEVQRSLDFTDEEFAATVFRHAVDDARRYSTLLEEEIQRGWTLSARVFWRCHIAGRGAAANA